MHELGITQDIVGIVLETAKQNKAIKVTAVNLKIGALTQIVVDSLEFNFEIITKDTMVEGAALTIDWVPTTAKCRECGHIFEVPDLDLSCPKCGDFFSEIIGGKELSVESIELE